MTGTQGDAGDGTMTETVQAPPSPSPEAAAQVDFAANLARIRTQIAAACARAGRRRAEVNLMAVSKRQPLSAIQALSALGLCDFGENYVQELAHKQAQCRAAPGDDAAAQRAAPRWHFIGRLQRNKVKAVVPLVASVHSVDNLRLAEALARVADKRPVPLPVFLQVDLAGEAQKGGVSVAALPALRRHMVPLTSLQVQGLMTVPPAGAQGESARPYFRQLRQLATDLGLTGLSMGMSGDYVQAIEEGASWVRLGTVLLGARQ